METKLIYSPMYDIRLCGLEKIHSFDSCKYSHTWQQLKKTFGKEYLEKCLIEPREPANNKTLRLVHSEDYLEALKKSYYVMQILEIPVLGFILPMVILEQKILEPMRLAVTGTILAAQESLKIGIGVNFSGGFHHASKIQGGGFCVYSDIAIAIAILRMSGIIGNEDQIVIIDLDAHQGNGLERIFENDKNVHILDMYNKDIYPDDKWAKKRIDYNIPLNSGTKDQEYLQKLTKNLPLLLNKIKHPKIAFYNAGTDIYAGDSLGKLSISVKGILERDQFVFDALIKENIPFVMLPSGGYSKQSHFLIANSIEYLLKK